MAHPSERSIRVRDGVGVAAAIAQARELTFKRITIERPALILVKRGTKVLRAGGHEWVTHAGEAIAIAADVVVDVINRPSASGDYEARCLVWEEGLVREHAERATASGSIDVAASLNRLEPAFHAAFDAVGQAIGDADAVPLDIARHRARELLIWLELRGLRFDAGRAVTPAERLRRLLGTDVAHDWTTAEAAARLALSESTLRRRLAEEGIGFNEILIDVRMSTALSLLQSSDRQISEIAWDVGYASASRFAVRFRDRFGCSPRDVRSKGEAPARA